MNALLPQAGWLDDLTTALAWVDPADWRLSYANARFRRWFPPPEAAVDGVADDLLARLPAIDRARAEERLQRGRPYRVETAVKGEGTETFVAVELRLAEIDGAERLVLEARDIGRQKQAEYMLDSYSRLQERHAREMQREKERVEKLLLNIMPRSVYEEMKSYGAVTPQRFDAASVIMLDFVGFTEMAIAANPSALVAELNDIFSAFDRIVEQFGAERIKTVGDCYIAVAGLPEPTPDHAANAARAALRMRRYIERRNGAREMDWRCRIGIGTGALIGSLIGIQKYVYDVFGPAANLAARLEHAAEPMQILIGEETRSLIADDFHIESAGEARLKGFGTVPLFALDGEV